MASKRELCLADPWCHGFGVSENMVSFIQGNAVSELPDCRKRVAQGIHAECLAGESNRQILERG